MSIEKYVKTNKTSSTEYLEILHILANKFQLNIDVLPLQPFCPFRCSAMYTFITVGTFGGTEFLEGQNFMIWRNRTYGGIELPQGSNICMDRMSVTHWQDV